MVSFYINQTSITVFYETELSTTKLFPIQCYEFRCDQLLLDNTLGLVKDLEYKSFNEPTGVLTSADIQQQQSFHPLMSWFQQCVDTMHVDTGLNCDRLVVNKAWSNKSVGIWSPP